MTRNGLWIALLLTLAMTGCADQGGVSKETIGTAGGAVVGGVVGQQIGDETGLLVGGVLGALAGRELGRRWGASDDRQAFSAFEENRTVSWEHEEDDSRYSVSPTGSFRDQDGRLCRHYTSDVVIEGKREVASGTACKRADGSWEVQS